MGFNINTPAAPATEKMTKEQLDAAIAYLRQGWNAQAFALLSAAGAGIEKESAARFALGLCQLRAGDLASAISSMEQALHLLGSMSAPSRETSESTETYLRLYAAQIADKIYLSPMSTDFCLRFPKPARETVLLALIYVYQKKGMSEQALKLAAGLTGAVFEEYKKKLAAANL